MAESVPSHDGHAVIHGVSRGYENDRRGHDFPDQSFFRGVALQDYFASIVALRQNTHQFAARNNQQRAYAFRRHLFNGLINGLVWRCGEHPAVLLTLQDHRDRIREFHGDPSSRAKLYACLSRFAAAPTQAEKMTFHSQVLEQKCSILVANCCTDVRVSAVPNARNPDCSF
jgi:hypothetical protein